MNLQVSKAMGASQVLVTDIRDDRLALAKQLGAEQVLNVRDLKSPTEAAALIVEMMGGTRPEACIETTGFGCSIETAILVGLRRFFVHIILFDFLFIIK
jgi:L-iditol 2-dehydrogenase